MKKNFYYILTLCLMLSLLLSIGGCKKGKNDNNQGKFEIDLNKEFPLIYKPEPLFIAVTASYPNLDWKAYLNKDNKKVDFTDDYLKALNIGSQIVDVLIALKIEDWESAKEIANSIKKLADDLHISNQDIENLAIKLEENIKNKDSELAKLILSGIQNQIENQLAKMVDKTLADYVQYGLWVNSYSKLLQIISDNYDANASLLIKQNAEVNFFINSFSKVESDNSIVTISNENLKAISEIINTDDQEEVSKDNVIKIKDLIASINNLIKS